MIEFEHPEILLRPETSLDKDFLLTLYISTRELELLNIGWSRKDSHQFLTQQFEAQYLSYRQLYPNAEYLVIEVKGEPVGRLYLNRNDDEFQLIDIALLSEFRNQGLGSLLIQSILEEAEQNNTPVRLHVEVNNPASRLYERLGFTTVENSGVHLSMLWQPH